MLQAPPLFFQAHNHLFPAHKSQPQALGSAGTDAWSAALRSLRVTGTVPRRGSSISAIPVTRAQESAEGIAWSGLITFPCLPPLHGQEEQWIVMEKTLTKEGGGERKSIQEHPGVPGPKHGWPWDSVCPQP